MKTGVEMMQHIMLIPTSFLLALPVFCADLTMSGTADAAEFVQDEPVFATLSFANTSNEDVELDLGDDGTGELTWKVVDPLGNERIYRFADRWDLKYRLEIWTTPVQLRLPGGGAAHHRIILNERGGFGLPGKYHVAVEYPSRRLSCRFDVVIGQPDARRLSARCLELARDSDSWRETRFLSQRAFELVAPKCRLETLAEVAGGDSSSTVTIQALLALGRVGGRPASEILIRLLPSTKGHARDAAIGALQTLAHDTPDSQLRDTILKLLASTPSGDPIRDCIEKAALRLEEQAPRAAALAIHHEKLTYSQMNERMPISQGEWDLATTIFERCRSTAPPAP
jgi:hypothetical protein